MRGGGAGAGPATRSLAVHPSALRRPPPLGTATLVVGAAKPPRRRRPYPPLRRGCCLPAAGSATIHPPGFTLSGSSAGTDAPVLNQFPERPGRGEVVRRSGAPQEIGRAHV